MPKLLYLTRRDVETLLEPLPLLEALRAGCRRKTLPIPLELKVTSHETFHCAFEQSQ
jgi:hypothetical protein